MNKRPPTSEIIARIDKLLERPGVTIASINRALHPNTTWFRDFHRLQRGAHWDRVRVLMDVIEELEREKL